MTDRELLELAAMAAGIQITPCTCSDTRWPFKHDEEKSGKSGHWNPLEDDGDALRLAVNLSIRIYSYSGCDDDFTLATADNLDRIKEEHGSDKYAATRRAIVRAAAEIGRRQADKATGHADSGGVPQKDKP